MVKLAYWMQKLTGSLLGSFMAAVLAGDIMVCVALILFGFDITPTPLHTLA
ncbi:MAG TPA: hypothetical protein VF543_04490 [Pyrinomonadaceae bacterium]